MSSAAEHSNAKHIITRPMMNYQKTLNTLLSKKYLINPPYYNSILINDIIFNEKTHLVAIFKDNLINDDESEFFKRYYNRNEADIRLLQFFVYYDSYSRIFPNYTALNEAKFIYKNIHKKQKMIDLQQENSNEENDINAKSQTKQQIKKKEKEMHNGNSDNDKSNRMFNTEVYTSIINDNEDIALIFDLTKNNQGDKEEEREQIDDLVNRISILEIRNESVIECPSMKSSIIHNKENPLCDIKYNLSKQSSINLASETFKKHFQSPYEYSQHQFSIKQIERNNFNNKQSGSDLRNNSNDHIFINRLRNDKQNDNINNFHSISQLSTTIQPQITPKYYPSLRHQTHREGSDGSNNNNRSNNAESTKVNSNYLLESNYKTPNAMTIRTKFRLGNNYELNTSQLKNNLIDQIKDNRHCQYFNSKVIESQLNQSSLRIIRNSSDKDRNDNKDNNKTITCLFSPFSSTHSTRKSSSIMNGQKIYYRNNQGSSQLLHHCNNDNHTIKSVGKTDMFCKVITKDKVLKGNIMNNINKLKVSSKEKNLGLNGGITSRASSKTVRQMNFENALSFRSMSYKNDKDIKIRNFNQLAVSTNLKQFPLQNIMQGIQIKHFSKAIHLIETPNKRTTNSDRSIKNRGK